MRILLEKLLWLHEKHYSAHTHTHNHTMWFGKLPLKHLISYALSG